MKTLALSLSILFVSLITHGQTNSSLSFNDVNTRVEIPSINLGNEWTIMFDAKINDLIGVGELLSLDCKITMVVPASDTAFGYNIAANSSCQASAWFNPSGYWHYSQDFGNWNDFALSYKADTLKYFFNGVNIQTSYAPGFSFSGPTWLGDRNFNSSTSYNLGGHMDNVVYWSRGLTDSEILSYSSCPPAGPMTDLIGFWNFDTISNGTVYDLSGFNRHGIFVNLPTQSFDIPQSTSCCAADITHQPISTSVAIGQNASFSTRARGGGSLTYQWQMDQGTGFANLTNSGQFSGVNTDTLWVSSIGTANDGSQFRCVVTDTSCSDTSMPATISIYNSTNYSFKFNDIDTRVEIPNINLGNQWTIMFEAKINDLIGVGELLSLDCKITMVVPASDTTFGYNISSANACQAGTWFNPSGYWHYSQDFGNWNDFALSYDGDTLRYYFNGINLQSSYAPGFTFSGPTWLGDRNFNSSTSYNLGGFMDNVMYWSKALSNQEVKTYSNCPPTGSAPNLIGLWNFDTISNGTVYDLSGFNRHGTLINSPVQDLDVTQNTCCPDPGISQQPQSLTASLNQDVKFGVAHIYNPSASYQWQIDAGTGFVDLTNLGQFSGTTTDTLLVSSTTSANNGYLFRCVVTDSSCSDTSQAATLSITDCPAVPIIQQPNDTTVDEGQAASFYVIDAYTNIPSYQWQANMGFGFNNISNIGQFSGANNDTLTVSSTILANNNVQFRCLISAPTNCSDTTIAATLKVNSIGLNENTLLQTMIFPNPAYDKVTVIFNDHFKGSVQLIDLMGRSTLEKDFSGDRLELNLGTLSAKGIYMVKVLDAQKNTLAIQKLIIE